jgi:ribosomal protein L18E
MRDAKTDNTIGLQEHTSMYVGAGMYDEVGGDMTSLNLEDFIGSRNKNNSLTNYQKVDDFADLFAKDYENLVNNDKIDPSKVTLQEYLDSLVLKEFAHKKDAPFWKELLESLSEMTVVIPIIEAATGKTLITGDYLTGDERAFKVVSGAVSLVTLGYGAAIAKGGGALAKMFAADILAEAVSGSTVIVCDKAGVPSAVTVALAIVLGSTTGVIADKALLKNTPLLKNGIEINDNVRYKKYWDDVANGKYDIPYGMTSEEYAQYLKGLDKVDKAIKGSDDVIKSGSKTSNIGNLLKEGTTEVRGSLDEFSTAYKKSEEYLNLSNSQKKAIDRKLTRLQGGNVATADVNIKGIKTEFSAHSQIQSADSLGSDVMDFSFTPSEEARIFTRYVEDGFPRYNDTEAKILEDIASQIDDPSISGEINLFTELDACQSCTNVILEFREKFPNIKLNVYTNSTVTP